MPFPFINCISYVNMHAICNFVYCFNRPGGIPAKNAKGEHLLLFVGIIDILQSFRLKKKLEHAMKSILHDGVSKFLYLLCQSKKICYAVVLILFRLRVIISHPLFFFKVM